MYRRDWLAIAFIVAIDSPALRCRRSDLVALAGRDSPHLARSPPDARRPVAGRASNFRSRSPSGAEVRSQRREGRARSKTAWRFRSAMARRRSRPRVGDQIGDGRSRRHRTWTSRSSGAFATTSSRCSRKQGCNAGACHGARAGQKGFRLTLFGFDVDADYTYLTRQAVGRRIVPTDPGRSLILTKPTGLLPHKGGVRLEPGSLEYRVLAEWIASGVPGPKADDPQIERLEVLPKYSRQSLKAIAAARRAGPFQRRPRRGRDALGQVHERQRHGRDASMSAGMVTITGAGRGGDQGLVSQPQRDGVS